MQVKTHNKALVRTQTTLRFVRTVQLGRSSRLRRLETLHSLRSALSRRLEPEQGLSPDGSAVEPAVRSLLRR